MRLVPAPGGSWHLIDEAAPPAANLIAVLRGPVEAAAVMKLCERFLGGEGDAGAFEFDYKGMAYRATPYSDRDDKLSVRIDGADGAVYRVETEFSWPGR